MRDGWTRATVPNERIQVGKSLIGGRKRRSVNGRSRRRMADDVANQGIRNEERRRRRKRRRRMKRIEPKNEALALDLVIVTFSESFVCRGVGEKSGGGCESMGKNGLVRGLVVEAFC